MPFSFEVSYIQCLVGLGPLLNRRSNYFVPEEKEESLSGENICLRLGSEQETLFVHHDVRGDQIMLSRVAELFSSWCSTMCGNVY